MRAAVYYSNRDVRLEERPRPGIGPGELLLRIEASGICGSDIMEWYRARKAPVVLGHEVSGTVEEVGAGVDAFRAGDRVVATHHVPCNTCRHCLSGNQSACDTLRSTGFDPGGFAEFTRLSALHVDRGTFALPEGVSFEEATFVEPLACVVRAQRMIGIAPGDSVAVLGTGVSGILQIQLARAAGATRIVATDVQPLRREMATRLGADVAIAADEDVARGLREANDGRPANKVIVCTAALSAIEQAFRCVERGGTILFFAPRPPGETIPLPLYEMWADGISIVHSYAGPPSEMRTALDLIRARRVDVAAMVTHRLPLERAGEGFRLMDEGREAVKVIIEPQR